MSSPTTRFIAAYVVLVALPVLGLLGVLHQGRGLKAPFSVDGAWQLQIDPTQLAATPCASGLLSAQNPVMTISQSGQKFTLAIPGALDDSSGSIQTTSLSAKLAFSPAAFRKAGCGAGDEMTLTASLDPETNPRSMAGTLAMNRCPACPPLRFRAMRQPPVERKAGR